MARHYIPDTRGSMVQLKHEDGTEIELPIVGWEIWSDYRYGEPLILDGIGAFGFAIGRAIPVGTAEANGWSVVAVVEREGVK